MVRTAVQSTTFDYGSLDDGAFVQSQAEAIRGLMKATARAAIEIGRRLLMVKNRLDHGQFGEWIERELEISDRSARMKMALAEAVSKVLKTEIISDLPLGSTVLYTLTADSTPPGAFREALERAQSGEKITVALAEGIVARHRKPARPATPVVQNTGERVSLEGGELVCEDCLNWLREQPDNSVDLIFGSPPYEDARTYGIDFSIKGQDWVDWMVERVTEMVRVSRGLVAMVVAGQTRDFSWSGTPFLLGADLLRAGIQLRYPPIFHRHGIPGSGGPDWLRNDNEIIICATSGGKLPWSDNTAMGQPPVLAGKRYATRRGKNGERQNNGTSETQWFKDPEIANPGSLITGKVGNGCLGWKGAHESDAPFPEWLAEFFIRSFCQPGGVTCDPFCGSGTTCAVAAKLGRRYIGVDIRESEINRTKQRLAEIQQEIAAA